jgi:hypothetical protein
MSILLEADLAPLQWALAERADASFQMIGILMDHG